MVQRKLVILGSSHATRLHKSILANEDFANFEIIGNTRPGATFKSLKIDLNLLYSLTSSDVLIVQFLGNDLLNKFTKITYRPKIIHLLKFKPQSNRYVEYVRGQMKTLLESVKAKIIWIDDPYRHLYCCELHVYPGLVSYLAKRNSELQEYFKDVCTVLDHRKIVNFTFRHLKEIKRYKRLLCDSVHLRPEYYDQWAQSIISHLHD